MIIARSAVGDHPKHKSKSVFLSTSHMLKYLKRHKLLAAGCSINSSRCWSLWHAAEKKSHSVACCVAWRERAILCNCQINNTVALGLVDSAIILLKGWWLQYSGSCVSFWKETRGSCRQHSTNMLTTHKTQWAACGWNFLAAAPLDTL